MNLSDENIINLIYKYKKGILSDTEKYDLLNFYTANEKNRSLVNKYYNLYTSGRSVAFTDKINTDKAWRNISNKISKNRNRIRRLYAWSISAAAVIILLGISLIFMQKEWNTVNHNSDFASIAPTGKPQATLILSNGKNINLAIGENAWSVHDSGSEISKNSSNNIIYKAVSPKTHKLVYNTIKVPRGGEYDLTLSDGTKVKLNAESELRYPVNFAANKRDVYLSGEGYFNVAHNKKAPFTVHISDTKIKVLGTKFNVSGYADEETIATTLVQGSVEVDVLGNKKMLQPGYQSKIVRGKTNITIKKVNINLYTSWITGVYEFENTDMQTIMAQLERWYNIKFFFANNNLTNIRFTGAIKRNKSINYALKMLEQITDIQFKIKDNYIVVEKEQ